MNIICRSAKEVIKASESIKASSERNDCFVYALGTSFDLNYDEAHAVVKTTFKRGDRIGTKSSMVDSIFTGMINSGMKLNSKRVTARMDKPTSVYINSGKEVARAMQVGSFAKKYSVGTYLILVASHALTIRDGIVIDNNNDRSVKSRVKRAYMIEG